MTDRETCCWTHCDNPQGVGTWTEIDGEARPVCEEHWYGNWTRKNDRLTAENARLRALLAEITALASGESAR